MPPKNEPRFKPLGITPTDEQVRIQTHHARRVIVMANAGSAKTTTLALRIAESLERGVKPEQVLALTFSEEAAKVLASRLTEIGVPSRVVRRIRVSTFADFALETLKLFEPGTPPVLSSFEDIAPHIRSAVSAVQQRLAEAGRPSDDLLPEHNAQIAEFIKLCRRLKSELVDTEEGVDALAERLDLPRAQVLLYSRLELSRKPDETQWRIREDGIFDLVGLLRDDGAAMDRLPSFRVLVVDELQDMSPAVYELLERLLDEGQSGAGKSLCYFVGAGDFDQVIHGWAGASVDYIKQQIGQGWPGVTRASLTKTFRHGPQMTMAVGFQKGKTVESGRSAPALIRELTYPPGQPEAIGQHVVETILKWRKMGRSTRECAILLRSPHQSIVIENALLAAGIGARFEGLASYLRRPEILFLRGVIAFALDDYESIPGADLRYATLEAILLWQEFRWSEARRRDLRTVADDPRSGLFRDFLNGQLLRPRTRADSLSEGLSEEDARERETRLLGLIASLKRQGRKEEADQLAESLGDDAAAVEESSSQRLARQRLTRTLEALRAAPADAPAFDLLGAAVQSLDIAGVARRIFIDPVNAEVAERSIRGFIGMARAMPLTLPLFAQWLHDQEEKQSQVRRADSVLICTIDSAKGQEFESVIVPYLEAGEFPLHRVDAREESNRFYVAITRMKDELSLIRADSAIAHPFVSAMRIDKALTQGRGALDNAPASPQDWAAL
ncbi:UvrD-helicase domain-containing protein [Niveibacterium terrae]|uniref:UvrD-helicase domain-containing protein n=1 Tax=Niveibacterium terrae TaxID=3373598 RepID=UPI003A8E5BD4